MPFPSKLTPAIVDRIVQQIAAGMSLKGAFRTAGAPPRERTALASGQWFTVRTGFAWLELGRALLGEMEAGTREPRGLTEHEELCVDLVLRVEQSLGLQEGHWIGKLQSGQGKDAARWQWLLERKFPEEYKATQRMELTGADGGPVATMARVVMLPALELEGDDERSGGGVAAERGPSNRVPVE